ncbi:MAG: hypothetical protein O7H41_19980 [Planctomycetota bacterium]|nr:hypothetical protein [Planctomycetota bacterium]
MRIEQFLSSLLVAALLLSCGSKDPPPARPKPGKRQEQERVREEKFERIRRFAATYPGEFQGLQRRVDEFLPLARGTPYEARTRKILQDGEEEFAKICQVYFEEQMSTLAAREREEDVAAALQVIDRYRKDRITPDIETSLNDIRARLEREIVAEDGYANMQRKAGGPVNAGEFDKALAMLAAWVEDPAHRGTAAAARMGPLVDEIRAKKAEADRIDETGESGWVVLFDGKDDSGLSYAGTQRYWKIEGGALVARNSSGVPIFAVAGEDDWKDYYVRFQFRIVKGEFTFGGRGARSASSGGMMFSNIKPRFSGYKPDKWYKIHCEVVGDWIKWVRLDNYRFESISAESPTGPFNFGVLDGAEIHFKGIQVKQI